MKLRYWYFAVLSILLIYGATAQVINAQQGILTEVLRRMDANNKALKSLKANVKMSKYNSQLDEYDLYEGAVQYLPAASKEQIRVRIDWSKPLVEHLAVGGGKYILYTPQRGQAIVGSVDGAKGNLGSAGALAFMSMNKAQLKANYDVEYIGEETVAGSVRTWHIKLTPKAANSYKQADLWVDPNGMPVQAKVTEKNNDTNTIQLSGIEKNASIKAEVFSIKPPKNIKIVQG